MSDHEARLISRITIDRDLAYPLRRGVTADSFGDAGYKDAFRFLSAHVAKYDEVPTGIALKREFPSLRLVKVEDCIEAVVDGFIQDYRRRAVFSMVEKSVQMLEGRGSPDDIINHLSSSLGRLETGSSQLNSVDLTVDPLRRFREYETRRDTPGGLLGIPTGFPTIDAATLGLQPGQLVTIIATPKTGKSQLALRMAANVQSSGYVPVFQSFEMSIPELEKRYDSMVFGLSHRRLLNGDLVKDEEKKFESGLKGLEKEAPFTLMDSSNGITVSALAASAIQYKPQVLFVDGVYLMIDEVTGEQGSPQALTNITRALKRMAQRMSIPVVISTQVLAWKMKKGRVSADAIGYSSSFYQDSDVIFGLEREEDLEDSRTLSVVASRNSGGASVDLTWDWETGIFEEDVPVQDPYTYEK